MITMFVYLFFTVFLTGTLASSIGSRIVGGNPVNIEDAPYTAALELKSGVSFCAGAIISENTILTAAHCFIGTSEFVVRVGSSKRESGGQVVNVKNVRIHPNYRNKLDYDIAVVELENKLTFGDKIKAVNLPEADETVSTGSTGFVTGWGYDKDPNFGGHLSDTLYGVHLTIPSKLACKAIYPGRYTDRMICAGDPIGGKDACIGDSGGPLVCNEKLVGIVSWGDGCGLPNKPGVYSDVSKFINFIQE